MWYGRKLLTRSNSLTIRVYLDFYKHRRRKPKQTRHPKNYDAFEYAYPGYAHLLANTRPAQYFPHQRRVIGTNARLGKSSSKSLCASPTMMFLTEYDMA